MVEKGCCACGEESSDEQLFRCMIGRCRYYARHHVRFRKAAADCSRCGFLSLRCKKVVDILRFGHMLPALSCQLKGNSRSIRSWLQDRQVHLELPKLLCRRHRIII